MSRTAMINKYIYIIIVVFASLCQVVPSAAAEDRNSRIQNVYFQALQAFESEKYLKGVQLYYRFVVVGNMPLSKAVRAHDLARAMGSFKKELAAADTANKAGLGIILVDRIIERFERADKRLDLLREKHPNSVLLTFLKGELALVRGDEGLAVRIFGTMNHLPNPRGFPALADYLLEQRGKGKKPDPALRRRFFMKIAFRRWDEMDFDGAQKILRTVMAEFPEDAEAPRALIDLLLQLDKPEDAVKIIDEWKGSPDEPLVAPLPLARIRYSQGKYEEAITLLRPLLEAEPQDTYLKLLMAESLFQMNRQAEAAPYFKELAAADQKNQGFLQRLVVCSEAAGKREEALPLLEAYVEANRNDSLMRFELASLFIRLNRLNEARLHFNILREYGNPLHKQAVEKIAAIDKAKYEQMMNTGSSNASGDAAMGDTGEGDLKLPPQADQEPISEPAVGAAGDTGDAEEEQLRRMKELFK